MVNPKFVRVTARPMPPANMAGTARKEGMERRASPDRPWPLGGGGGGGGGGNGKRLRDTNRAR